MSAVAIERLGAESYKPKTHTKYVDVHKLEPLFELMFEQASPPNLIMVGPKGVAKSLSVQAFAAKKGIPIIVSEGSEDMRRSHLIGMYVLRGNETVYVLGDLTAAIEVANEVGCAILIMEEVNALTPQVQKLLNPLCDFRKSISVPECGRVFELKQGAKLWVVGTMNTTVYGGVYALNEDLKSRFRILPVTYPDTASEKGIVNALVPTANPKVVSGVLTLAHETRQEAIGYALSTRDVIQLVEDATAMGLRQAVALASGKYEDTDRETFMARARSIFVLN